MLEDLAAWGAPQDVIEAKRADQEADQSFGVWEAHWDVLRAFLASATQWRIVVGLNGGGFTGLDYAGVRAGLKMERIKLDAAQWTDFRQMEAAALDALKGDN